MLRKLFLAMLPLTFAFALSTSALDLAQAHVKATTKPVIHLVKIVNTEGGSFAFSPATIKIKVGQVVTWKNVSGAAHTATSDTFKFDTGTIDQGKKGTHKFKKAGTFKYHCAFHSSMHGTVKVVK